MAKRAVTLQERLEKLIAGTAANPDGPKLDTALFKTHVESLNKLEYQVNQAKLALAQAVKSRDERLNQATDDVYKAEYTVKAFFGPRSPKLQEYILPGAPRTRTPKKAA